MSGMNQFQYDSTTLKLKTVAAQQGLGQDVAISHDFRTDRWHLHAKGLTIDYIWSPEFEVWYTDGDDPANVQHALMMDAARKHAHKAFALNFNAHKGKEVKTLVVTTYEGQQGEDLRQLATSKTWKLGLGPCGRVVLGLKVDRESMPGWLVVWQWCEDHPVNPDEFCYPLHSIKALRIYQTETPKV